MKPKTPASMRKFKKIKPVLVVVLIVLILAAFVRPADRYFEIAKNLDIFATLFKEVNAYYVDEVDPDRLVRTGIDAMLAALDPYTNYIPEDEIETFRTMTTGQYAGIGALIGAVRGKIVITLPYEGLPAYKAGLKTGDEIISVDGVSAQGKGIPDISTLLKGQAKTEVKIEVRRYGVPEPITFVFKREKISLGNVPYYGKVTENIGYIKLEDFMPNAGKEVAEALKSLKNDGAEAIILDLRNNPGGLLHEAVNVSNAFIPKNKDIVSTKGKVEDWNKVYKTIDNPVDINIPLVVLVNENSASASEIVSGVMQDYDRAVLIGAKTFGKGLVQTTRPLSYNAQLKVTTAKYYIPSGRCIQALDYTHRNVDGTVNKIPDSLKVRFTTENGRIVYDGAGLDPDITVKEVYYAPITATLLLKGLIFDYATLYTHERQQIPSAESFTLTEEEYQTFKKWLVDKDYDYTTYVEQYLDSLETSAKREKYYEDVEKQFTALKAKIKHNKNYDLEKFKEEIKYILQVEIASRFYGQRGNIEASFSRDEDVKAAIEILNDNGRYRALLSN